MSNILNFNYKRGIMTIETQNQLIKETILKEFDDAVAQHGGIARDLWGDNCPKSLKEQIDALPKKVEFEECGTGKVKLPNGDIIDDLRNLDFITVDPQGCKDMDDAVYCEMAKNGDYILYTAIADVPRYFDLTEDDLQDEELQSIGQVYFKGGYTMYSPFKAYNILPEQLSDNLCSLKPGEDRLAFVTKIVIDPVTGRQKGEPKIMEAVVRSRAKLSYNEAQAIIDGKTQQSRKEILNEAVYCQVILGQIVADAIRYGFACRDMVRFPDEKERLITIEDGQIKVETEERLYYQDVIEAFMIMTNEANARFAQQKNLDVIYRMHASPNGNNGGEDIVSLVKLLQTMPLYGFEEKIDAVSEVTPGTFNRIFDLVKSENGAKNDVYRKFLSRIQARAKSSPVLTKTVASDSINGRVYEYSHFGLQSDCYMHITSPIRRITDYVNIKNILAFIQGKKPLSASLVEKVAKQSNFTCEEVDKAEIDFNAILASHYYSEGRMINATLCDFDYSKNGYCIFEDDETGFRINVPIEEFSNGLYIEQEKWGFSLYGDVIASLGQKEKLLVQVNDDLTISGHVLYSRSRHVGEDREEYHSQRERFERRKLSKQKAKMRERALRFERDFDPSERE